MAKVKFDSDDEDESKKKEKSNEGEGKVEGAGDVKADEEAGDESQSKRKRKRKRKKKSSTEESDAKKVATGGDDAGNEVDKLNSLDHTVYVEGIPFVCTEDAVKEFFVTNGCPDVLQMRLPRWQDSGRLRGYGHIVFDSIESRAKALKDLNGLNLQNRYLNIQEPKPNGMGGNSKGSQQARAQPDKCAKVFVKNLPYQNITEDDVKEVFRSCGKIVDGGIRLARNYSTRELKGFGYVEFKNPEGAFSAVQRAAKGGIVIGGRSCYVDYDEGSAKGSFRGSDGKLWAKQENGSSARGGGFKRKFR